jgi:hypothetical protein
LDSLEIEMTGGILADFLNTGWIMRRAGSRRGGLAFYRSDR